MKWLLLVKYLLYAKTKAFLGFFTGGVLVWFPLLFADIDVTHWGLAFVVKAAGAVGLAFITGIAGALGKQLVDSGVIKTLLSKLKRKNNGKQKRNFKKSA